MEAQQKGGLFFILSGAPPTRKLGDLLEYPTDSFETFTALIKLEACLPLFFIYL